MTAAGGNEVNPPPSGGIDEDAFLGAFQSIVLEIAVRNGTSRTEISQGTPTSPRVSLIEFLEHGFALELPRNSCARGHSLILELRVTEPAPKRMKLAMTAKVETVTKEGEQSDRVDATLIQFDEDGWERLQALFSGRQTEIEEFFLAAKGF